MKRSLKRLLILSRGMRKAGRGYLIQPPWVWGDKAEYKCLSKPNRTLLPNDNFLFNITPSQVFSPPAGFQSLVSLYSTHLELHHEKISERRLIFSRKIASRIKGYTPQRVLHSSSFYSVCFLRISEEHIVLHSLLWPPYLVDWPAWRIQKGHNSTNYIKQNCSGVHSIRITWLYYNKNCTSRYTAYIIYLFYVLSYTPCFVFMLT